jgi:O-antigen/teichoic acid export membrane protein
MIILFHKVSSFSKQNSSVFILAGSTISFFLLNIFFKSKVNSEDYGRIALLLTYVSLLSSFGLFGAEQLLIRRSAINQENKSVTVNSNTALIIGISLILQFLFPILYHKIYKFSNIFIGIGLSFIVTLNMLTYNIFRIAGRLNMSQLNNGSWKFFMLLMVLILMNFPVFRYYSSVEIIIFTILFITSLFFIYSCIKIIRIEKVDFQKNQIKKDARLAVNFFISLLSGSFLAQGDRLLISEVNNNFSYIGEYLFLGTIIIFPYNFLQGYFGFKYLSYYKTAENPSVLLKKNIKEVSMINILFTPLIILVLVVLIQLNIVNYVFLKDNIFVVFLMFVIGITRLYYSIFSSIMGANASIKKIRFANLFSYLSLLIGIIVFLTFPSMNSLVLIFCFLWFVRLYIWYHFSVKTFYEF